ncbi:MAG TPA: PQQ-binding-like beta-propeller repeat protein [Acidimicrobiales bacterium]
MLLASASIVIMAGTSILTMAGAGSVPAAAPGSAAGDPGAWTVYHHDALGRGVAESVSAVDTVSPKWTSATLDGQLYGEPLVSGGRVYVATENNTVYGLSAATGAVAWENHLASPVPASSLPCGNIGPTVGITGTPVIDAARGEVFVVADEWAGGRAAHVLVGLSVATGHVEMSQDVDPRGANPAALLQRTGLSLDAGRVVFGFGGNYGDCSVYRGQVVAVGESGGTPLDYAVGAQAGGDKGAIWMGGGAPAVDSAGDVWVSAGNGSATSPDRPYDGSDSVLELSSSLRLLQFFAPTSWASDNRQDLDLSMEPVMLADGQVIVAGKSRTAYLLDGAHLGGIGGQLATLAPVCGDDIDGGGATVGTTAYLPCLSGVAAVEAEGSRGTLRLIWSSGSGGGPPIVAAGLVWTIGQNGELYGLDPDTGAVRQQASIGAPASHFPTPSVGDGLLVAPARTRVVAFAAPPVGATPTPGPATTAVPGRGIHHAPTPTTGTEGSGPSAAGIAALAVAVLAVMGAIGWLGWLGWRRRTAARR